MKLKLLILLISLFGFAALAQNSEGLNIQVKKTFYPNGKVKTEGDYWYDKLHGLYNLGAVIVPILTIGLL